MLKKALVLSLLLLAFSGNAPKVKAYTCQELVEEWYDCLGICDKEDMQYIYWDLVAGGCIFPVM